MIRSFKRYSFAIFSAENIFNVFYIYSWNWLRHIAVFEDFLVIKKGFYVANAISIRNYKVLKDFSTQIFHFSISRTYLEIILLINVQIYIVEKVNEEYVSLKFLYLCDFFAKITDMISQLTS